MTVYVDVYFLVNFFIDFFAILLCRRILGYHARLFRALLSALVGACYAVIVLHLSHPLLSLFNLGFGALMVLIACGFGSPRRFLRLMLFFYGVCFFLGGSITAIARGIQLWKQSSSTLHITAACLLFAALVAGGLCLTFGKFTLLSPGKRAVTVTLTFQEKTLSFQGYADTGNLLQEPLEGIPVILANASLCRRICALCGLPMPDKASAVLDPASFQGLPLRVVACDTVGGRKLLTALKFSNARIDDETRAVCIALDHTRQSDYGGFEALIPHGLL